MAEQNNEYDLDSIALTEVKIEVFNKRIELLEAENILKSKQLELFNLQSNFADARISRLEGIITSAAIIATNNKKKGDTPENVGNNQNK